MEESTRCEVPYTQELVVTSGEDLTNIGIRRECNGLDPVAMAHDIERYSRMCIPCPHIVVVASRHDVMPFHREAHRANNSIMPLYRAQARVPLTGNVSSHSYSNSVWNVCSVCIVKSAVWCEGQGRDVYVLRIGLYWVEEFEDKSIAIIKE